MRGNQTYGAYSILIAPRGGQRASALGPSALDLDWHSALHSHSHAIEQGVSNSTEHDLTALRATLTTRQEALDQRELGLAVRQERIEGADERIRDVQRAVGYHEEDVGPHKEVDAQREKEERKKAVSEREVQAERRPRN
jgi:hypothetical protein